MRGARHAILLRDQDRIFGHEFVAQVKAMARFAGCDCVLHKYKSM